jgi:LacI family transcriptional regulator
VSLICGGDDDIVFETMNPTITGVLYDKRRVGYLAAQTLDQMMQGRSVPKTQPVAPLGVMARQTTEFIAVEDPLVEQAVRYIWQQTGDGLAVRDVLAATQASERTLHRRFKQHLGRTPADEIRRAKLETARRLLSTTDMPLVEVAAQAGYGEQSQLSRAIKEATGQTPTAYRRQFRGA